MGSNWTAQVNARQMARRKYRVPPLGHAVLAALKLTRLFYRWTKSRIGQQLVRGRKPGDIARFAQYGCCQNNTNSGNGCQLGIKLFEKRWRQ